MYLSASKCVYMKFLLSILGVCSRLSRQNQQNISATDAFINLREKNGGQRLAGSQRSGRHATFQLPNQSFVPSMKLQPKPSYGKSVLADEMETLLEFLETFMTKFNKHYKSADNEDASTNDSNVQETDPADKQQDTDGSKKPKDNSTNDDEGPRADNDEVQRPDESNSSGTNISAITGEGSSSSDGDDLQKSSTGSPADEDDKNAPAEDAASLNKTGTGNSDAETSNSEPVRKDGAKSTLENKNYERKSDEIFEIKAIEDTDNADKPVVAEKDSKTTVQNNEDHKIKRTMRFEANNPIMLNKI